jgi:hypothetical protein
MLVFVTAAGKGGNTEWPAQTLPAAAPRFEDFHNCLNLSRVVEHSPRRPQTFLPPNAQKIAVGAGQFASHAIQFGLFGGAQAKLIVLFRTGGGAQDPGLCCEGPSCRRL